MLLFPPGNRVSEFARNPLGSVRIGSQKLNQHLRVADPLRNSSGQLLSCEGEFIFAMDLETQFCESAGNTLRKVLVAKAVRDKHARTVVPQMQSCSFANSFLVVLCGLLDYSDIRQIPAVSGSGSRL